jgi:hypothetical protein
MAQEIEGQWSLARNARGEFGTSGSLRDLQYVIDARNQLVRIERRVWALTMVLHDFLPFYRAGMTTSRSLKYWLAVIQDRFDLTDEPFGVTPHADALTETE